MIPPIGKRGQRSECLDSALARKDSWKKKIIKCPVQLMTQYIPIHILHVGKVVCLKVGEDSLGILNAWHPLEVEGLTGRGTPCEDLSFL